MIKSFADKYTEALFNDKSVLKWKNIEKVARRKLNAIHFATQLKDLTKPPRNRLEALKGEFKGKWSIRINKQYRVIFEWKKDNHAYEVEISKHYEK